MCTVILPEVIVKCHVRLFLINTIKKYAVTYKCLISFVIVVFILVEKNDDDVNNSNNSNNNYSNKNNKTLLKCAFSILTTGWQYRYSLS